LVHLLFFFFQAEDGIRVFHVTEVQTCALPISRMPWLFDDEAVDVLRFFNNLKTHLMPYLLDTAKDTYERGIPMMRAMVLEFPSRSEERRVGKEGGWRRSE